ncbi:GNAT family N-acetyltransferase [Alisedimentitalea sp. MJ-SS2]|uniref:GNAT family N-acetyltransferase n=1 Tax=Aliisedimentitalea sp. MJ-SS2 TaxID=3049795 RepID=UPI002906D2F5|nr:GNAT family N-acetyltransferase [Alisedimentitalea sp. MJ-SS2]MDU8929576.1 GNAT family N-acetyltransferase [Alisedimentitalea sp. MJ-SS2]
MPELQIRPARARDAHAVGQVLTRSYAQLLSGDYCDTLLQRALPILTRPRPELLGSPGYMVALRDGRIVAAGGWSRVNPYGGEVHRVGHVRHVACDPGSLRTGVARELMLSAMEQAREVGIGLLSCLSTLTAIPFYRSLGFEGEAEIDIRLEPGLYFPAVEMRKRLS